jgi:MFS family permease
VLGRRIAPLGVRPFGRLLASYTVNEIGDSVGIVALAILVYDRTGEVVATAALFLAAKFVPALLAPAVTARIDQFSIRRTLPIVYLGEACAFAGLALLSKGDLILAAVLALAFVDGTLAVTGRGLTRGAVASALQPAGLLREGNALMNVGFAGAAVGGSALAGLLVGAFSLATALYADAVSFLIIAVLLATAPGLEAGDVTREPFMDRFRAGIEYARRDVLLKTLLLGEAVALVLFTLVVPVEIVWAREFLHTDSVGYGILLASWGAGIVVGSMLYLRVKNASAWVLVATSTLAIAVAYLGLALAQNLTVGCAVSVLGGIGNGIQWIAVMTALQEKTPTDYQARITGLMESIGAAMPGIGYFLGGVIAALWDPRVVFAVAGIGLLALVAGSIPLRSRLEGGGVDPPPPPANGAPKLSESLPAVHAVEAGPPES